MLLSSKGKHRRPSKAVRIATLAGVTGAAVAVPLMGATSRLRRHRLRVGPVAQCESGGNWSINTGNGYYGGLQFSQLHLGRRTAAPPYAAARRPGHQGPADSRRREGPRQPGQGRLAELRRAA